MRMYVLNFGDYIDETGHVLFTDIEDPLVEAILRDFSHRYDEFKSEHDPELPDEYGPWIWEGELYKATAIDYERLEKENDETYAKEDIEIGYADEWGHFRNGIWRRPTPYEAITWATSGNPFACDIPSATENEDNAAQETKRVEPMNSTVDWLNSSIR